MVTLEVYIVQQPEQVEGHVVRLHSETDPRLPFCDCAAWARLWLPCKHILAVILYGDHSIGWSLPEYYHNIPQFNVDHEIASAGVCSPGASTGDTADTEGTQLPEGLTQTESAVCVTTLQSKVSQLCDIFHCTESYTYSFALRWSAKHYTEE